PEAERRLPLYIYEHNGEKFYILSVRGNGLWDEIWGNIALKSDGNTIAGAAFDHKGETPGLGAEIKDNPSFPAQFEGKKIYEDGQFVSVKVRKGGAKNKEHEVDAISGATVTSDGVTEMLYRGIEYYQPFLKEVRQSGNTQESFLQ
ncbi:MAG: NADH:ubiquinone reductase (Na(+)-transporting) subunit C, partial [Phaeodactylibacter sp.]|nr:NADH:ubiquinone reductase (Na(+)-transporting) subunit C [Phaeodactylibacter sp.]